MRRRFFQLHKYAGLTLGILLSVMGLSGSLLVFYTTLDERLTPALQFEAGNQKAPLEAVASNAIQAVGLEIDPARIYLSTHPNQPHMVRFRNPDSDAGPIQVHVNPYTAEVLAVRVWGQYTMTFIYYLHHSLLAGEYGHYLVGALGVVMLFFIISGVVIWWPRKQRWRRAFTIKRDGGSFRFLFDLHKTTGIYLALLLLVSASTGFSLVFHEPVDKLVETFFQTIEYPSPKSSINSQPVPNTKPTADQILAQAQQVFPDASPRRLYYPRTELDAFSVSFNQPGEAWSHYGATMVWLDQYSGETLATWNPLTNPAGNTILSWMFPLHNGDALGLAGRWLMVLLGLAPALLFATGVTLWLRKRRPAKAGRGNTQTIK